MTKDEEDAKNRKKALLVGQNNKRKTFPFCRLTSTGRISHRATVEILWFGGLCCLKSWPMLNVHQEKERNTSSSRGSELSVLPFEREKNWDVLEKVSPVNLLSFPHVAAIVGAIFMLSAAYVLVDIKCTFHFCISSGVYEFYDHFVLSIITQFWFSSLFCCTLSHPQLNPLFQFHDLLWVEQNFVMLGIFVL